jgi:hypothetical protein
MRKHLTVILLHLFVPFIILPNFRAVLPFCNLLKRDALTHYVMTGYELTCIPFCDFLCTGAPSRHAQPALQSARLLCSHGWKAAGTGVQGFNKYHIRK